MKSIFTRTYIILIFLMILGFVGSALLIDNIFEYDDGEVFKRDAQIEALLFKKELNEQDIVNGKEFARNYKPYFETKISVLTSNELMSLGFNENIDQANEKIVSGESFEAWWLISYLPNAEMFLLIEEEAIDLHDISFEEWAELLFPFIIIFCIVGFALLFISRYIAKPIHHLSDVLDEFGKGGLEARVTPHSTEPLKSLGERYNLMAIQIQKLIYDHQVLIGALPHELRTPVARTRFALGMTKSAKTKEELYAQLESVDGYLAELESVVEDALNLSRTHMLECGNPTSFALLNFLQDLSDLKNHDEKNIVLNCALSVKIFTDKALLKLALGNLIENALTYGNETVKVSAYHKESEMLEIMVEDDGSGIPEDHRQQVFTPFFRLDKSRSRATGGVGLGLALVKIIVDKLGGTISITNSQLGGACFILTLKHKQALSS